MIQATKILEIEKINELIEKTNTNDSNNHSTYNLSLWLNNEAPIYYRLILLARYNDKISFVKEMLEYNSNNIIDDIDINKVNINSIYNEFKEIEADEIDTYKIIKTLVRYEC